MKIGNTDIKKIKLENFDIKKILLGITVVFDGILNIVNSYISSVTSDSAIIEGQECIYPALESNYSTPLSLELVSFPVINFDLEVEKLIVTNNGDYFNSTENPLEITYQWYKDGIKILYAESNDYYPTETGVYLCRVTVSNTQDILRSLSNSLNVTLPILIESPTVYFDSEINKVICFKGTYEDTIKTTYSYKWFFNNELVSGITTNYFVPSSAGDVKCEVTATNPFGTIYSMSQVLTLQPLQVISDPFIVEGAAEIILTNGIYNYSNGVTFSYKWFKNEILTDVTTQNYPAVSGEYYCEVTATNPFGSVITLTNSISILPSTVFEIDTTKTGVSNSSQYKLPLVDRGPLDITVFWGDGTSSIITSYNDVNTLHTYPLPGIYTISILGELKGYKNYSASGTDKLKLLKVLRVESLNITEIETFRYCENMEWFAQTPPTISTTSLRDTFQGCLKFNGNINNWDISNVTNLQGVFASCSVFNQPLNDWNTSNVTTLFSMFQLASIFNQPLNNWDTSNVIIMSNVFNVARGFNQPLGNWNLTSTTSISGMFASSYSFNQDISSWDTSNVIDMNSAFSGAISFNQDISNWNTSNVTNMSSMFRSASKYNQPLNWDVSSVTNMSYMFQYSIFNQDIGFWDVSSVTNMYAMFDGSRFNQNIGNWNISNVTNFRYFNSNSSLLSPENLDAIYNGWSSRPVKPNIRIEFGSANYTAAGQDGKNILLGAPNNWTIIDGGII